jgi:hypothetical protein
MLFRNLTTSLEETGCQGGQGSPRAVAPSEEELILTGNVFLHGGSVLIPQSRNVNGNHSVISFRKCASKRLCLPITGNATLMFG